MDGGVEGQREGCMDAKRKGCEDGTKEGWMGREREGKGLVGETECTCVPRAKLIAQRSSDSLLVASFPMGPNH
eukprot:15258797-Alexandrium_andersonii.AAC.1